MARGYKCDGCDELFEGEPANEIAERLESYDGQYEIKIMTKDVGKSTSPDLCGGCMADNIKIVAEYFRQDGQNNIEPYEWIDKPDFDCPPPTIDVRK